MSREAELEQAVADLILRVDELEEALRLALDPGERPEERGGPRTLVVGPSRRPELVRLQERIDAASVAASLGSPKAADDLEYLEELAELYALGARTESGWRRVRVVLDHAEAVLVEGLGVAYELHADPFGPGGGLDVRRRAAPRAGRIE